MLTFLKVLSIIGILLLCLMGLLLFLVLLILFLPVTYRIGGHRSPNEMEAWVKVRWLLGLLRVDYRYPEPNKLVVRLFSFVLFDSGAEEQKGSETAEPEDMGKKHSKDTGTSNAGVMEEKHSMEEKQSRSTEAENTEAKKQNANEAEPAESDAKALEENGQVKEHWWERVKAAILAKIVKIKYTILKICDRIKNILKNIDYYRELLAEEETRELYLHVKTRIGKILKNIRPGKVKADIQFGTGSPDTTGYAIGVFGMLSPFLGKHVHIVPSFEEAILLGEFYVAGHVTGWVLLINALSLFMDQRLRRFLKRMKREDT